MKTNERHEHAVELLQQLGLKEYEANCFVALSRVPRATAKEVADLSDVPRTRVYDAIRVLEAEGLVETQHSSPKQFRAVPLEEGLQTLRQQYKSRVDQLESALKGFDGPGGSPHDGKHQVWSLSGQNGISTRSLSQIEGATEEVVLVVGSSAVLEEGLLDALNEAAGRGVTVIAGAITEEIHAELESTLDGAELFRSGLEWLRGPEGPPGDVDVTIGRMCLIDRETVLVSSVDPTRNEEQAIFGTGFTNGFVVVVRRLMATGLLPRDDPGTA